MDNRACFVFQEITDHNENEGRIGDCYRACIASLLGRALRDVPHFVAQSWDGEKYNSEKQRRMVKKWAGKYGLGVLELTASIPNPDALSGLVSIVTGAGPRGVNHCCLYRNGKLLHDPHPSGYGLTGPCQGAEYYWFEVFAQLAPWKHTYGS